MARDPHRGPPPRLGDQQAGFYTEIECEKCRHCVVLDAPPLVAKYGAEMPLPALRAKLVCSKCGARNPRTMLRLKDPPGADARPNVPRSSP